MTHKAMISAAVLVTIAVLSNGTAQATTITFTDVSQGTAGTFGSVDMGVGSFGGAQADGQPITQSISVTGLTLDSDGVANDSISLDLVYTASATGGTINLNGLGAIGTTGGTDGAIGGAGDAVTYSLGNLVATLSGGGAHTISASFTGFGVTLGVGDSYAISGADSGNGTGLIANPAVVTGSSFTLSATSGTLKSTGHDFTVEVLLPVPEPNSIMLALVGLAGIGCFRRRNRCS